MNDLLKYYTSRLIGLAIAVALGVLLIDQVAIPKLEALLGEEHILIGVLDGLTSRFSIFVYLTGGEYVIRKYLWKLENSKLNFEGMWDGVTEYKKIYLGEGSVPFSSKHEVRIDQDCLSLRIAPTESTEFVNWGSLALDLAEGDTLRYAYWVNYKDARFPDKAKGYEEMKVTKYDTKNRPLVMTGEFFHCALGLGSVYSGTVTFTRRIPD